MIGSVVFDLGFFTFGTDAAVAAVTAAVVLSLAVVCIPFGLLLILVDGRVVVVTVTMPLSVFACIELLFVSLFTERYQPNSVKISVCINIAELMCE